MSSAISGLALTIGHYLARLGAAAYSGRQNCA
jgi:hypothetical protein